MTDPCLLRILPLAVRVLTDSFLFHILVAWHGARWWRCLPKQIGQAESLSCQKDYGTDDRKLNFFSSGDRERFQLLNIRLTGDLEHDSLDLVGLE